MITKLDFDSEAEKLLRKVKAGVFMANLGEIGNTSLAFGTAGIKGNEKEIAELILNVMRTDNRFRTAFIIAAQAYLNENGD